MAGLGLAALVRGCWPRTVTVVKPGTIVTVTDTVDRIDTVWATKITRRTDTLYLQRVIVTKPDTVFVLPRHLYGLTALSVPRELGAQTRAQGFELEPGDSGRITRREWSTAWWTAGPLEALSLDTFPPRLRFGAPPPKGCGLFCSLKKYAIGGAIGGGLCLAR